MNTAEAISKRQSIRSFRKDPVPSETLREILRLGAQAPSPKNLQNWQTCVVGSKKTKEFIQVALAAVLQKNKAGIYTGSAVNSLKAAAHAPVHILVFQKKLTPGQMQGIDPVHFELADTLSLGAFIQNMLLAARSYNLGSLWSADVLFASEAIGEWCGTKDKLVSMVTLGYPNRVTPKPSRRELIEFSHWID